MTRGRWICAVFLVSLAAATTAQATDDFRKSTSLATVEIKPPEIVGTIWVPRETIEGRYPIDLDGDMQYTTKELLRMRIPLVFYIQRNFMIMWDGKMRPLLVGDMRVESRPGAGCDYLAVPFVVKDCPKDASLMMVSRLIMDFWPSARCVTTITRGGASEMFVLGPEDYYRSSRPAPALRRYACPKMCWGIELKDVGKCPRCGTGLAPVEGGAMPGVGAVGRRGGMLVSLGPGRPMVEAVLARQGEMRVYLTNASLDVMPVGKVTGSAQLWTEERDEGTPEESPLRPASDGTCLTAAVPATVPKPIHARCTLDFHDNRGEIVTDFVLTDVITAN